MIQKTQFKKSHIVATKFFSIFVVSFVMFMALTGCIDYPTEDPKYYDYFFEEDMQGWEQDGTDLSDPPINWSIEQTANLSYQGNG